MTRDEVMAALDELTTATPPEGRPALVVQLAARLAAAAAGMAAVPASTNGNGGREAEDWLAPDQAAAIARVPVTRIYQWARGARWASRPTRRCLRIAEQAFRRWLASKGR